MTIENDDRLLDDALSVLRSATDADAKPLSDGLRARVVAAGEDPVCESCRAPIALDERVQLHAACFEKRAKKPSDRTKKVSLSCSYCHEELPRGEAAFCAGCLAPHHADCFAEHGECSAIGCGVSRVVRTEPISVVATPRRRSWRRAAVIAATVLVSFAPLALVAWRYQTEKIRVSYGLRNAPVDVPVATRDIRPGEVVSKADITIQQFPHGVIDALGGTHWDANETDKIENAKLVAPIKTGQVFQQLHFRQTKRFDKWIPDPLEELWDGGDWGDVLVDSDLRASYSANCGTGISRMIFRKTGPLTYSGTWGESSRRYGTIDVVVSDNRKSVTGRWEAIEGKTLGSGPSGLVKWTVKEWPGESGAPEPLDTRGDYIAKYVEFAAESFVTEIWLNGLRVPDAARKRVATRDGVAYDRLELEIREGDWLVFQVANDRARGEGFLAAWGLDNDGKTVFQSSATDGWFVCEEPGRAHAFVASKDGKGAYPATPSSTAKLMSISKEPKEHRLGGEPLRARSGTTWIKCVVSQSK